MILIFGLALAVLTALRPLTYEDVIKALRGCRIYRYPVCRHLVYIGMIGTAAGMILAASCVMDTDAAEEQATIMSSEDYLAAAGSPVMMDVTYGFEGTAKSGRYLPVKVSLSNSEDVAFQGYVSIQAMESDYEIYEYNYPISLAAGETAVESMDVPGGRADVLYVKLLDSDGRELMQKRVKLNVSLDVAELLVGLLSDTPDQLAYMNGVGVSYSSVRTKAFSMKLEEVPDNVAGLDLLDVLLITNFDTSRLSKDQTDTILEWVKGGGTLLIGTGNRADDTLAAFRDILLAGPYAEPHEKPVDMGVEYATDGPGNSFINLSCADITLKNGTEVMSNDEFPVLTSVSLGNGLIGVAAYDFVDIAAFCQVHRSYVDKMFTSLLGENKLNNLSSFLYSGNSSQYWSVQNMLNTGDVDKLPNLGLYAAVILGYICLVGPGLYLILKKQERRRFYRTGVVMTALLFCGIIYLMGVKTRFKSTFFTYATILDSTDSSVNEYTYINMRTPYNKSYNVAVDPSYDLMPVTRSSYYDSTPVPKFLGDEDYKLKIEYEEEETKISVQNVVSFSPKYFFMRKKTENDGQQGFTGDITLFDGHISGSITNNYPYSVEKVGVLMYGQMVVIDSLEAGETKSLDGLTVINYPLNNSSLIAERITGGYQYTKTDIENPDYMLALSRTNVLRFFLDSYASTYSPDARIVAFSKEQSGCEFLVRGDYESYGMTLLTSTVSVNTQKNGYTYRSGLVKAPAVTGGQYFPENNMVYGVDPVTLEYSLGSDVAVDKLTFETLSEDFLNNERYGSMTQFNGNMYFYNHDTGNYDVMDSGKKVYNSWELTSYLSPGNTLTVKYICDNTNNNNWYVSLPMPIVLGREK